MTVARPLSAPANADLCYCTKHALNAQRGALACSSKPATIIQIRGQRGLRMRSLILAALIVAGSLTGTSLAQTSAPADMGRAGWWIYPCQLFVRRASGDNLKDASQLEQAALCQGLFTGVMSVNYSDPPYLPFCVRDDATEVGYVVTFISFMKAHPSFADKSLGLTLLVALGKAYPKAACSGGSP